MEVSAGRDSQMATFLETTFLCCLLPGNDQGASICSFTLIGTSSRKRLCSGVSAQIIQGNPEKSSVGFGEKQAGSWSRQAKTAVGEDSKQDSGRKKVCVPALRGPP